MKLTHCGGHVIEFRGTEVVNLKKFGEFKREMYEVWFCPGCKQIMHTDGLLKENGS